MQNKKPWLNFALAFGLVVSGALVVKVAAQSAGQAVEAAVVAFMNASGLKAWTARVDSAGVLNLASVANGGVNGALTPLGVQLDPASGAMRFPAYASQQLASMTPPASYYIVTCTNCGTAGNLHFGTGILEISTGTGAGAWSLY